MRSDTRAITGYTRSTPAIRNGQWQDELSTNIQTCTHYTHT